MPTPYNMNKTIFRILSMMIVIAVFTSACDNDKDDDDPAPTPTSGNASVELQFNVGSQQLKLDGTQYTNSSGETYDVTELKLFISNISFKKADGTEHKVANSYHFIDADDASTHSISLTGIPVGEYTEMMYYIGVDSIISAQGASAFTGDLLPQNSPGMYWAWAPGFKFVRFEGNQNGTSFKYHIGGYSGINNTLQKVQHILPANDKINVLGTNAPEIHTIIDIAEFFKNPNDISFATLPDVHAPGADAKMVSENYRDMTSIDHVHN